LNRFLEKLRFRIEHLPRRDWGLPNSVPLPLSGHKMLRFPLDRHHIREYVKHPRELFSDPYLLEGATTAKTGARLKVETSRLPLLRETIPPQWMETSGDSPRSGRPTRPLRGNSSTN
jgi:hypothetical protein